MKIGFYPKLALTGIRRNSRLYIPYLLNCSVMIAMYYIVSFLSVYEGVTAMRGGPTMQAILVFGCGILAIFSTIFLFYTHAFLVRRRKREFGLYNILGMGKWNLARITLWESLITAAISLVVGLVSGIVLSKLAELGLVNIMHGQVTYTLALSIPAIIQTATLFLTIFALVALNAIRQVGMSTAIALLRSENVGEKPPKANWLFALVGVILLAAAYYLAVTIQEPLLALAWFFVAVSMVILATYLLFISGSVALCRILQKNKGFYYKPAHFVSVSSMTYRMKRNGAGLASICILCTMVLVMIAGSACLYFGAEDSLLGRYPRDITLEGHFSIQQTEDKEQFDNIRAIAEEKAAQYGTSLSNPLFYRYGEISGRTLDGTLQYDNASLDKMDHLYSFYFIPLEDYNRMTGENESLAPGEAIISPVHGARYPFDILSIPYYGDYKIVKTVPELAIGGIAAVSITTSCYVIVPDLTSLMGSELFDEAPLFIVRWIYAFDTGVSEADQISIADRLMEARWGTNPDGSTAMVNAYNVYSLVDQRLTFYGTYGGLFFLGIVLSIVFLFAAVLIIYYKQVSEGYEDQSRFDVMQKVGMTRQNIRKSVNSQMLTVFLLPLVTAVIHLGFAFPMIFRLLLLFNISDLLLLLEVAGVAVLVFALFYTLVYRFTSNAYYHIVSGARTE